MNAQQAPFPFTISLFLFNYFYWDSSCMTFINCVHGKLSQEICSRSQPTSWKCTIFKGFVIELFLHWYKNEFHDMNTYYDFLYTKIYMHDCFDLQGAVHGLQNSRTKTDSSTILKGYFFSPLVGSEGLWDRKSVV